jgi:hypothetical protein
MAEREGFEPPVAFRATAVFKTARFDRSRTSPITTLLLHFPGKYLISLGNSEVFKTARFDRSRIPPGAAFLTV